MQEKVARRGDFCFSGAMKYFPRLLLAVLAVSLSACATKPRVPQFPVLPPERHVEIGRVEAVNYDKGFVMVRTAQDLGPEVELQTRDQNNAATATLRTSVEKHAPFVIADILKGRPLPGEVVTRKVE